MTKIREVVPRLPRALEKPIADPPYYASMLGFRNLADHLIAGYPEHVNARGGDEEILRHIAARAGHASILTLLLEHGTDVDGRHAGQTPLHRASCKENSKLGSVYSIMVKLSMLGAALLGLH
jgi:ankyrin repeat protein